jgi:hypothetical protein
MTIEETSYAERLVSAVHRANEMNRLEPRPDGTKWSCKDFILTSELEALAAHLTEISAPSLQTDTALLRRVERAMHALNVGIGVHNDRKIDRHVPIEGPVVAEFVDALSDLRARNLVFSSRG